MELFSCKLASSLFALDSLFGCGRWRPIAEGELDTSYCFMSLNRGDVKSNRTFERIVVRDTQTVFS